MKNLLKALLIAPSIYLFACAPKTIVLKNYKPVPLGKTGIDPDDCLNMAAESCKTFHLINNIRANNNLPKLIALENCISSATAHSQQMAEDQNLSHDNSKITWVERIKKFGATGESMAENIGLASLPEKVTDRWMNSDYHKKNILNTKFNYTGVAHSQRYWTQCFIEKVNLN